MRALVRLGCGIAALAGGVLLLLHVARQRGAATEWQREFAINEISKLAPREASISELYRSPPPPGRRVRIAGFPVVRDTIRTERPIIMGDRPSSHSEGLIFLHDSLTGERLVLLRRLDRTGRCGLNSCRCRAMCG